MLMHGSTRHAAAPVALDMAVSRAIDVFTGSIRHSGGADNAGIFTASIARRGEVGPAALLAFPVRLDTAS